MDRGEKGDNLNMNTKDTEYISAFQFNDKLFYETKDLVNYIKDLAKICKRKSDTECLNVLAAHIDELKFETIPNTEKNSIMFESITFRFTEGNLVIADDREDTGEIIIVWESKKSRSYVFYG